MAYQSTKVNFTGVGIQNEGGSVNAGRDININTTDQSNQIASLLSKLYTTDPRLDKKRIEKIKGGLLDDCCDWVLHHEAFVAWRDSDKGQLLWIRGDPGKGKTMLVCGIINQLHKAIQEDGSDASIAYFFLQATDERINTATAVLRSLAHTLLKDNKSAHEDVAANYANTHSNIFTDANGWFALCDILTTIIDSQPSSNFYLLIDALDECVDQLEDLLEFVAELPRDNVKVLVSSRNWPEIDAGLRQCPTQITLRLELNKAAVSQAVLAYIDIKVEELTRKKSLDQEMRALAQEYFQDRSDDTFLWVALVCQELSKLKITRWNIRSKMESFPSGLGKLYDRMAGMIADSDSKHVLKDILAIVSLAYRPLGLMELASLVEHPDQYPYNADFWIEMVESCGSFLAVQEERVFFVHQSSQDYTMNLFQDRFFSGTVAEKHGAIAVRAIASIDGALRENMYGLTSTGCHIDDVVTLADDPLEFYRYSCIYWADHVCDSVRHSEHNFESRLLEEDGPVKAFFEAHFLHWLESLSLLGASPSAIVSLAKLIQAGEIRAGANPYGEHNQLLKLMTDGVRFVRYFIECIRSHPIHLYTCAPVFTPSQSPIGGLFHRKAPVWMKRLPEPREDWGQNQQTIETGSVICSFSLSPSGERIASGHEDGRVRVWNFVTGQLLQIYEIGGSSSTEGVRILVTFSATDDILAAGTNDGHVHVCNANAKESRVLGKLTNRVRHLAFASDGRRLLSATGLSSEVAIWTLGLSLLQKPTFFSWSWATRTSGHFRSHVESLLALSPNSVLAACTTKDKGPVEIWNTLTWICELRLPFSDITCSPSFSPDSTKLAASNDKGVQIHGLTGNSGESTEPCLTQHSTTQLRWHPDGDRVGVYVPPAGLGLLACSDGDVQWLNDGSDPMREFCFSKDGGSVVCATHHGTTIRRWDWASARKHKGASDLPLKDSSVYAMAPNHDMFLAKNHENELMQLYNTFGDKQWSQFRSETIVSEAVIIQGGASPVIATLDEEGELCMWKPAGESITCNTKYNDGGFGLQNLGLSRDGAILGALDIDGCVLLRIATGEISMLKFPIDEDEADPDFRSMAVRSVDNIGLLAAEGQAAILCKGKLRWLQESSDAALHPVGLYSTMGFSPCGIFLAAGYMREDRQATLKVWNVDTGECQQVVAQCLPIVFRWGTSKEAMPGASATAIFRRNFSKLEIVSLIEPRQAHLRQTEDRQDWLCLGEELALWLPDDWRLLGSGTSQASYVALKSAGWAGPSIPLCDGSGYYMGIEISPEYLAGQND